MQLIGVFINLKVSAENFCIVFLVGLPQHILLDDTLPQVLLR